MTVAPDIAVLAARAQVHRLRISNVSELAWRGRVHARERSLLQALDRSVAELHLHHAPVHEVELLLNVVVVKGRFDTGRDHDRVDSEGRYVEALAHLAEAGAVAEVVEMADSVALAPAHLLILGRTLHLLVSYRRCVF